MGSKIISKYHVPNMGPILKSHPISFKVQGSRVWVWVWCLRSKVRGSLFNSQGVGFMVQGPSLGFMIQGQGLRVEVPSSGFKVQGPEMGSKTHVPKLCPILESHPISFRVQGPRCRF